MCAGQAPPAGSFCWRYGPGSAPLRGITNRGTVEGRGWDVANALAHASIDACHQRVRLPGMDAVIAAIGTCFTGRGQHRPQFHDPYLATTMAAPRARRSSSTLPRIECALQVSLERGAFLWRARRSGRTFPPERIADRAPVDRVDGVIMRECRFEGQDLRDQGFAHRASPNSSGLRASTRTRRSSSHGFAGSWFGA
jgi:hypothetical protein